MTDMTDRPEPTTMQHAAITELNDKWGVATWTVQEDGSMIVELDDGDEIEVDEEGEWEAP